jgi:5-methylcytosine-specific restriction endonuclease McrA
MRKQILARDGNRCVVPGCRSARQLDAHHIIFRSLGGPHALWNLCALCSLCRARHNEHYAGCLVMPGRAATSSVIRLLYPA